MFEFDPSRPSEEIDARLKQYAKDNAPIQYWSPSALNTFERCPQRIYLTKVMDNPEPQHEAASRGEEIHDAAEHYIMGTRDDIDPRLNKVKDQVIALRKLADDGKVVCEENWGITRYWEGCTWQEKDLLWGRVKLDVCVNRGEHGQVIDWKSGKSRGNEVQHSSQLMTYAVAAIHRYPQWTKVRASCVYTDEGKETVKNWTRGELLQYVMPAMTTRALRLTEAVTFDARPSKFTCLWCPHRESGVCDAAYKD